LVAGQVSDFPDINAFAKYLQGFAGKLENGRFILTKDSKDFLSLHLESGALPEIDGETNQFKPGYAF
jgi:hypothetical protein